MIAMDSKLKSNLFLFSLICFSIATTFPTCQAILLNIPASGTKCVSEDIQTKVVVLADYLVISQDHRQPPSIFVKGLLVTSPYGNNLHHAENVTSGQFAFTTAESGNYLVCFWLDKAHQGAGASVSLDWKVGIAAKDWDSVAKKEKIEGVELELRKLEGIVEVIHENLIYLKNRSCQGGRNEDCKRNYKCEGGLAEYLIRGSLHRSLCLAIVASKTLLPEEADLKCWLMSLQAADC